MLFDDPAQLEQLLVLPGLPWAIPARRNYSTLPGTRGTRCRGGHWTFEVERSAELIGLVSLRPRLRCVGNADLVSTVADCRCLADPKAACGTGSQAAESDQ